jgi:RNA polymerase sigma-70 factor (ECF subfamily)
MADEASLLRAVRKLDETALGEVYRLFSPGLYRYAMRLLGHAGLAEECVAETFERMLKSLSRGRGPKRHLKAYLYRIAHNWVTDRYRRYPPNPLPLDELRLSHPGEGPEALMVRNQDRERARLALHSLTPDQRQVIMLKFLEGWKNPEIARALDKPVGAVKSLQHRGLAALRRILITNGTESDHA